MDSHIFKAAAVSLHARACGLFARLTLLFQAKSNEKESELETDLQRLFNLLDNGYRIVEIDFTFDKNKEPQMVVDLKLTRGDETLPLSSSQGEFISHVGHLHSIPHIKDDGADFVYVEDSNRYFELQEMIIDLLSGKRKELIICERRIQENNQKLMDRAVTHEKNWILAEKDARIGTTKLCQIFYDVGVLLIKDSKEKFELVGKENLCPNELQTLLKKSQESDAAVCYSAFIVSPKFPFDKEEQSDTIIGLIVYDLKNRQILSLNLNSLRQVGTRIKNIGKHGLWECIRDLFERTNCGSSFRSFLPLPINMRDFTPLPWFCFVFMKGITGGVSIGNVKFDLPLFLAFGTPLLLFEKPSYGFDANKQMAFVMLGFKEDDQQSYYQVRFDMSKGEPKLHLDVQAYHENKLPTKLVSHSVINYKDVWDFSQNLATGFLLASVFDVNFDTIVIPKRISGINEAFGTNPLTVYPLFVRSMAATPFKRVRGKSELSDVLHRIAKGETAEEGSDKTELENMGLVRDGKLTILGDIVHARWLQTK